MPPRIDRASARRVLVIVAAVWIGAQLAGAAFHVEHGLHAEYFDNPTRAGAPRTAVDADISTDGLTAAWLGNPPGAFSARWYGFLTVDEPGRYAFATRSDDSSAVMIDSRPLVENPGGLITLSGAIDLTSGPHQIVVEYAQVIGEYEMHLQWAPPGRALEPIPDWRFSTHRVDGWRMRSSLGAVWIGRVALVFGLLWGAWMTVAFDRPRIIGWVRAHPRIAVFALFSALAIAETWPLAAHPAQLSRNDNDDTVLNEWVISWVAHQAVHSPVHLFDGNIFYPERNTIAYSESMVVQSAMALPLRALGASPVLTYNLLLILGFALSGWTMTLVVARWTDNWSAGLVSGTLFAFNAHTLTRLPHMQALHPEFLPLTLLAFDTVIRAPGVRHVLALAAWYTLNALTSMHLFVFATIALILGILVRPADWIGARFLLVFSRLALAGLIVVVVLWPFIEPYWYVYRHVGLVRSLDDIRVFAASWRDYLTTPSRVHFNWWSRNFFSGTALFPGAIATLLTLVAVGRGTAFRDPRARMCLAFGIAGIVLSFGPKVPGFATLYAVFPMIRIIRGAARYGYLGIVAAAMLAGWGVVELKRIAGAKAWPALVVVLIAAAAGEALCAPIWYRRVDAVPRIYAMIRNEPDAVVVEFPFYNGGNGAPANVRYMLNSTEHWKPMLNGFSGFIPPSYHENFVGLRNFPDEPSIARLRDRGVTHVFVHSADMAPGVNDTLARTAGFRRLAAEDGIVLYRLERGQAENRD
jgi:hypothetical protein